MTMPIYLPANYRQESLFADDLPPSGISLRDRVAHILDEVPDARNDDALLTLEYWCRYDGLASILEADVLADFCDWFRVTATSYETIRRRRQEIQRNREDGIGHLRPSPSVERYRRERDGAGPPRR
jgi:hypothetical protein